MQDCLMLVPVDQELISQEGNQGSETKHCRHSDQRLSDGATMYAHPCFRTNVGPHLGYSVSCYKLTEKKTIK